MSMDPILPPQLFSPKKSEESNKLPLALLAALGVTLTIQILMSSLSLNKKVIPAVLSGVMATLSFMCILLIERHEHSLWLQRLREGTF